MNLREALQQQAPSLALQRAAADEIARLDGMIDEARRIAAALEPYLSERSQPGEMWARVAGERLMELLA